VAGEVKIDDLVAEFARSVMAQDQEISAGNPRKGNAHAKRYFAAFDRLRAHGDVGRDALAILLSHEDPGVRVIAATFLLRHCQERARAVLEAEARGSGMVAFSAGQALKRWDEGTWQLDPAPR
jgi:hypothetical protein